MDRRMDEFRRKVHARRGTRRRGAPAYDEQMRALALDYVSRARQQGRSWTAVARELGISAATLQAWTAAPRSRAALVPVVVESEPRRSACLMVITPSGLRIEGLDVESAAALVRALG